MIYFDNSATTRPCQAVADRINENLTGDLFGNPGSLHTLGLAADTEYKRVTGSVASMLGAKPDEIFFTSCGSESANTAIRGYMSRNRRSGNRIISTRTEHKATLEVLKMLESEGYEVVYVHCGRDGKPDMEEIKANIDGCSLMCFTHVNNETGAILPLEEITAVRNSMNRNCRIYLDCVQSLGKLDINLARMGVDMASFSGHKIHGIKGVGVLYVKNGVRIDPLILGGGQQKGMRSGTESLLLASSFEAALSEAVANREKAFGDATLMDSHKSKRKKSYMEKAKYQNAASKPAVMAMRNTQRRGALPPKNRSVAQPANNMPPIPANSNSMITVPVSLGSKPLAS